MSGAKIRPSPANGRSNESHLKRKLMSEVARGNENAARDLRDLLKEENSTQTTDKPAHNPSVARWFQDGEEVETVIMTATRGARALFAQSGNESG